MTRIAAIATGLALMAPAFLPAPALAQAFQCRVPERIEAPRMVQPDGPTVRAPVDGYTLAISWSPEYCRGGRGQQNAYQCSGQIGRFGFVLHGLWPEARKGPPPQWCALEPRPSQDDLRQNLCMTPVPWLLEHEWAKHGSCMATTPAGYYKTAGILWNALKFPDADALSRQPYLTAGDLRQAFVKANPGFRPEAVGVLLSNGGWLRELRLCYRKDFLPRRCDKRGFGPANATPVKIWRGL